MATSSSPVLAVTHLSKSYGDHPAVNGISFEVKPGEIVGLLGPNGAGKTTTIDMILGVLAPSGGTITINGSDIGRERSQALGAANFAAVYAQLPGNLTVVQNLNVFALLYDVPRRRERIEEVIAEYDLARFRHVRCGLLSSGEQTRVGLAKAILNRPRLLLLDEPTASLDPLTALSIRRTITRYAADGHGGVLWTSHNMHEVADVCDRILFLSHGKILLAGDPKTLPQLRGEKDLEELFIALAREPL